MQRSLPPRVVAALLLTLCASAWSSPALGQTVGEIRDLMRGGDFARAESLSRDLVVRIEARAPLDSLLLADALDVLVESLVAGERSRSEETMELALRAVALRERLPRAEDLKLALSLTNLAGRYRVRGDYLHARPLLERALAIRERVLGANDPEVAASLNHLANVLHESGDLAGARPLRVRALAIREAAYGPDHRVVAQSLMNLGNLSRDEGDYAQARRLQERALAIFENTSGPGHLDVANCITNLANVLHDTGDLAATRPLRERALAIYEKVLGPQSHGVALALENLANLMRDTADPAGARPLYERALPIFEHTGGPDSPEVAWCLLNLAEALRSRGALVDAQRRLERALGIVERSLGPGDRGAALCLVDLARVRHMLGDDAEAIKCAARALAILEERAPTDLLVAHALHVQADVAHEARDFQSADRLYARALDIVEQRTGADDPLMAALLRDRARLHVTAAHPLTALEYALQAEASGRSHTRLTLRALPERQALDYVSTRASGLDQALSVTFDVPPVMRRRVYDAVIRSRSLVLDEMAARHRIYAPGSDTSIARLAAALVGATQRLANLTVSGPQDDPPRYRRVLEEAKVERERCERALAQQSLLFRREQSQFQMGLDVVASALPPRSALVSFVRFERREAGFSEGRREVGAFIVFLLVPGGAVTAVPLGPAPHIDSLVAAWGARVAADASGRRPASSERLSRHAGEALRRAIWDPVSVHLPEVDRAFVVLDGSLLTLSLATLPLGRSGYLVESPMAIHYLSTERDLASPWAGPSTGEELIALGNPSFDDLSALSSMSSVRAAAELPANHAPVTAHRGYPLDCPPFSGIRFSPLPATALEIQNIARIWNEAEAERTPPDSLGTGHSRRGHSRVLLQGQASEAMFKEWGPRGRVIHVATHGFFLDGKCQTPFGTRGIGGFKKSGSAMQAPEPSIDPMRLSGLVFAGANQRASAGPEADDGILTAEEIVGLDLSGVRWAVLSGCQTGAGELMDGEGVAGFRRAFQVSGAGTVIMSLWSVQDEATRQWMEAFYRSRFIGGTDTAAAVRHAQLDVLRSRRAAGLDTSPFFWGGFVAVGDWR